MASHARLGDKIDCVARVLDGQDLVFDIIRQLSLTKDAADIHKDNSARLVIKTKALLNKPMYAILAKIDNAVDKQKMDSTAEEGVVANLDVFCVHDVSSLTEDEQVTLRHMLFSTEFTDQQIHLSLSRRCFSVSRQPRWPQTYDKICVEYDRTPRVLLGWSIYAHHVVGLIVQAMPHCETKQTFRDRL